MSNALAATIGGAGAAVAWTVSTLAAARASRLISAWSVLSWVALVGLVVNAPLAAVRGGMEAAPAHVWLLLVAGGGLNVGGLGIAYGAYRHGKASLIAPILSTEGSLAALIAIVLGETVQPAAVGCFLCIAVGLSVAVTAPGLGDELHRAAARTAAVMACAAALTFGASLYAFGDVAREAPAVWVALAGRIVGVVMVAGPLVATRRATLTAAAVPLVIAAGVAEVAGTMSYAAGARHDLAIAAVLSTQFATLTVVFARFFWHERLSRRQWLGIAAVAVGVSVLAVAG